MKKLLLILYAAFCLLPAAHCQYAPQAGVAGSTAIHKSSPQFTGWANACSLQLGWMNINDTTLGRVNTGDSSAGIGMADNMIVSLGDSGVATLYFTNPITNGTGYDFAVFENGFPNPADPEEAFLELSFVEVSSDGINFFRFPTSSLTQIDSQILGSGMYMNARKINNLAGKYMSNYGTPFDLGELAGITGLNIHQITHVRIVDVIGDIVEHSSFDKDNNVINDPFSTPFPTGGFDLDAVGAIHQIFTAVSDLKKNSLFSFVPNPATEMISIRIKNSAFDKYSVSVKDVTGKQLMQFSFQSEIALNISSLESGIYFITVSNERNEQCTERLFKY